ncbi:MAG: TetM/TetW/TetO/TetS family tetracycline resistance ribosomal protection protein [Oscillospiraceae bacterium]|nr:TetM/TetW/TetO/TetS family tetracycline resistance ribosomal protection protein [Oscillospiraceae bacterium]
MENEKNVVLGILAHVDAGKTTLCEAMLYLSGKLKKLGRVDHRDSFLDTHALERQRGITIFSKQAVLPLGEGSLTLLDTPGHVDFSAEAERTLRVLDCAVLVISGTDGVQAHTETLWKLLERYHVPTFLFITKMDLPGPGRDALMAELTARLSERCVDFGGPERDDAIAMCDEGAMEEYLENGSVGDGTLRALVASRRLFPCFFGSGLKTEGVGEFLDALEKYAPCPDYGPDFAARVYKISRDAQGNRLTWLKVTGGSLKVRTLLRYNDAEGNPVEEKISGLRVYSGQKFDTAEEVRAGWVCAALGLSATRPGQGLGAAADAEGPVLEPVMSYRVLLPKGTDPMLLLPKLMQLDQEDPQLHVVWNAQSKEISVQLMGKIQTEIFKSIVRDRFDTEIELDTGRILYRETIKNTVEGVGHFEPLRHYAEVHVLLEPLPPGSGVSYDSIVPEDVLDRNWQRLILTHLAEKQHRGVLTGSPVTDMRITLAAGRAHLKHTEGGDFRQATYRAVRQGLMQADSVLLEPWYSFVLEVPAEQIGRAITDIRAMNGDFSSPEEQGEYLRLEGAAPAVKLNNYMEELVSWSHGRGRLSLTPCGYRPCADQKRIVEEIGYEPERDEENPADSVFCAHGAGMNVNWRQVPEYMHLESVLKPKQADEAPKPIQRYRSLSIDDRELEAIMEREFGPIRRPEYRARQVNAAVTEVSQISSRKEHIIVDGYNLIFAWDELKALARDRLDLARERLMDILSGYAGFTGAKLVLVFDGFRTPGNPGSRTEYHNISVAFTKDGETADAYIERIVDEIGKNYAVRVVTSDNLIRLSALRSGVLRCSSGEFKGEAEWVLSQIEEVLKRTNFNAHQTRLQDGQRRDP